MKNRIVGLILCAFVLVACGSKEEANKITTVGNVVYSNADGEPYFAEMDKNGNTGKE